jgi:hypothetical protein
MKSFFECHTKHFLKVALVTNTDALVAKQAQILKGKTPTYPLHLTLAVIHVLNDTPCSAYFVSDEFSKDLVNIFPDQSRLFAEDSPTSYAIMGTKPECFAIVYDNCDAFKDFIDDFKKSLCLLLCNKYDLIGEERLIDEKYEYMVLKNSEGVEVLKMPWSRTEYPVCHVTLFTSFDLKRCNKPLFKKYEKAEDKLAFLSKEWSDADVS